MIDLYFNIESVVIKYPYTEIFGPNRKEDIYSFILIFFVVSNALNIKLTKMNNIGIKDNNLNNKIFVWDIILGS